MRLIIKDTKEQAGKWAAYLIVDRILKHQAKSEEPFVLGLPTGSSPLGTYKELVALYKAGKVSFKNVITFNMDEYIGIPADHPQSYSTFMWTNFFNHIDIKPENINLLDGNAADPEAECERFEKKILEVGGIDLFMGGVGENGHLAFNEPYTSLNSRTHVQALADDTIAVNSRFFDNDISKVPTHALSVGIATVLSAKEVLILAFGPKKAKAVKHCVEGVYTHVWPISALQTHPNGIVVCDDAAATEIKVSTYRAFKEAEKDNRF